MAIRPWIVLLATSPLLLAQGGEAPPKPVEIKQWNSAVGLGGGAGGRFGMRGMGRRYAGHPAQISAGLSWLANAQGGDGAWTIEGAPEATIAVTSLAVLAMLGDGNTMRTGPHRKPIKLGIKWLREQQRADGAFADGTGPHLLATLAMSEAYLLSNYRLLKPTSTKALAHAGTLRHADGGWRASPKAEESDPALTMWGATVLGTAEFGDLAPASELAGIGDWLRGPRANMLPERGILGVNVPITRAAGLAGEQAAANVFTRLWLELPTKPADTKALERVAQRARDWPTGKAANLNLHEWYCSSYALQQANETEAVAKIAAATAKAQVSDGPDQGSWAPVGIWGEAGGRVWTTAMAVLILEAPYRYTRLKRD